MTCWCPYERRCVTCVRESRLHRLARLNDIEPEQLRDWLTEEIAKSRLQRLRHRNAEQLSD